jgi:hypothetical protein
MFKIGMATLELMDDEVRLQFFEQDTAFNKANDINQYFESIRVFILKNGPRLADEQRIAEKLMTNFQMDALSYADYCEKFQSLTDLLKSLDVEPSMRTMTAEF